MANSWLRHTKLAILGSQNRLFTCWNTIRPAPLVCSSTGRLPDGPLKRLLAEMGQDGIAIEGELEVFYGGPVDPQRGFVLHSLDYTDDRTRRISEFSSVTTSPTIIRAIAEGRGPRKFLFVLGYTGWGAGQLENEIKRRSWISVEADEPLVLGGNHERKWGIATAKRGVEL